MYCGGNIGPRGVEEISTECCFWGKSDGMYNPIKGWDVLTDPTSQSGKIFVIGNIKFDDWCWLWKSSSDPLSKSENTTVRTQNDIGALFLRQSRNVESNGGLSEDSRDQYILSVQNSHPNAPFLVHHQLVLQHLLYKKPSLKR
jgi:hypothetical protein